MIFRLATLLACATCLALLAGTVGAAPERDSASALPPLEQLAPRLAGERTVRIEAVRISGNRIIAGDELAAIAQPLIGREVGPRDIEAVRHGISRLYAARGYLNSGAIYEDPAVLDGELRLKVVEGRVSGFRVSGADGLDPGYVTGRLAPPGSVLNLARLQERYQLLLADPLLDGLDVVIEPGTALGEATLAVDLKRARPWSLTAFANNHRSVSTGEAVAGLNAVVRNLTGHGDALDATLQLSQGAQRSYFGWRVPLGVRATELLLSYDNGDARVVEAPLDDADVESKVEAFEVALSQALIDRLERRLVVALAYGERRNTTTVFGQRFSFNAGEADGFSRVRAWRFSQEYLQRNAGSVLALRSTFNVGRSNALADDPADGQAFPARSFGYWVGQGQYRWQPAAQAWRLHARLAVQKAQDVLVPLERFALGGRATVRGYRENSLVRDNGYAASLEWRAPPIAALPWLGWFAFHDHGAAWNRNQPKQRLRSVGLGLSAHYRGLQAELMWARNIDDRVAVGERGLQDRGVHFALGYDF